MVSLGAASSNGDETYPTFIPQVPQDLLVRYGARVLDPATAVVAPGRPAPRPTVYCTDTLIVPKEARQAPAGDLIDGALQAIGLALADDDPLGRQLDHLPVRLRAAGRPAVVDAWAALQEVRAAADALPVTEEAAHESGIGRELIRQEINKNIGIRDVIAQMQLEHLLVSANLVLGGAPGPYQGVGPGGEFDSYAHSPGSGPLPVKLLAAAPSRGRLRPKNGFARRPVVAVVDTGYGKHPWLAGYVRVDEALQATIKAVGMAARQGGPGGPPPSPTRPIIEDVLDAPVSSRPLVGEIDPCYGHSTLIAGVLRQLAPKADVLVVRVMHPDGIAREAELYRALMGICDLVDDAQIHGHAASMVDIVSLSLGYYNEDDHITTTSSRVASAIAELTTRGVLVVAAAGNHATQRPFYPAAAARDATIGHGRMASVGALNPAGTRALFSNGDETVTHWRSGAGMVSTLPVTAQGARQPPFVAPSLAAAAHLPRREAFDRDGYRSGFGVANGTSFAVPVLAAQLANALIAQVSQYPLGNDEQQLRREETLKRAQEALRTLEEVDPNAPE